MVYGRRVSEGNVPTIREDARPDMLIWAAWYRVVEEAELRGGSVNGAKKSEITVECRKNVAG